MTVSNPPSSLEPDLPEPSSADSQPAVEDFYPSDPETSALEHRPHSADDAELGFSKAKPVRWLSPTMLVSTAVQVVLSDVFGEYLDKRDLQKSLPSTIHQELGDGTDLWFDFVADLGDGFDATYSIAYLLAQRHLTVNGTKELPRGRFLIMGGDEIYPTPSWERYQDKTKGPYGAAMPLAPAQGPQPNMYALPGNHDWYDGLTSFMRLFAKSGRHHIGGWNNEQARSYFAIELPHHWWILAIDTQFGAYIDDAQLTYFNEAAARMKTGDKVILCSPTPSWVEAVDEPGDYDAIDYFVRTVLNPRCVDVKLMLSGDLHHYARYAPDNDQRQLIHCGGGGAYLFPTHRMPEDIPVPPKRPTTHKQSEKTLTYRLKSTFPSKHDSRKYAAGVFSRVPLRNPGFVSMLGAVQTLLLFALVGLHEDVTPLTRRWLELPIAAIVLVIMAGAISFARMPTGGSQHGFRRIIVGAIHGAAQIAIGVYGTDLLVGMPLIHDDWPWPIAAVVAYYIAAGIVSTVVFCLYLLIASAFGINTNELFSGQSIDDSKSFLRLHLDKDGKLTVYAIAVPKVSHKWRATPSASPHAPWLEPAVPIVYQLAEPEIKVG